MRLQIDRQHDGKRVGQDGRNVVAVGMRGNVGAILAVAQPEGKQRKSERADQKSQAHSREESE